MMTREQRDKAVEIAKDVIKQIEAEGSYRMTERTYFCPTVYIGALEGDVRDHIEVIQKDCRVCMLGSLMLSKARIYDAVPIDLVRYNGQRGLRFALADVFDDDTLDCLESAFEMCPSMGDSTNSTTIGAACFGMRFKTASDRALAVAQNIIDNDGLFVVESRSLQEYVDFEGEEYDYSTNDSDDFYDDDPEDEEDDL